MFKRTSRGAALAASVSLALLVAIGSAKANILWGAGQLISAETTTEASKLAFNQSNPIVINTNGSIPTITKTTQFAVCLVNNADGSQRVVMMLRYLDGSVYTIVNPDANLAALAGSSNNSITLTDKFYLATSYGQTTVRQEIRVNGTLSNILWGGSPAMVSAFKNSDGTCKKVNYAGYALSANDNSSM